MTLPHVQVMTRRQCGLCDEAKLVVAAAAAQGLCTWQAIDVDDDPVLCRRYGLDVPVVLIDGRVSYRHRVQEADLRALLVQDNSVGSGAC